MSEITDKELEAIEQRAERATPGPWFVRRLDDEWAATLLAVSTSPGREGRTQRWPDFDEGEIVAATLVQSPNRYVTVSDERWDENADFIAAARSDIPRLIAEIRRLRQ
jgi:hypothetical protein